MTQEQGLPSDWVFAFTQDAQGLIWIGTDAGLAKFDGYTVEVFKSVDEVDPNDARSTFASNKIRSLYTDSLGYIWIGSANGGLSRFDPERLSFKDYPFSDQAAATVRAVAESKETLLIGTSKGLYRLPLGDESPQLVAVTAGQSVNAIAIDDYDDIWLGTSEGLYRYRDSVSAELQRMQIDDRSDQRVLSLVIDNNNTLWAGVNQRLYSKPSGSAQLSQQYIDSLNEHFVTSLVALKSGQLAIGTFGGLYLLEPSSGKLEQFLPEPGDAASLNDVQLFKLLQDRSGSLWIGSYRGGVNFVNPSMQRFGLRRKIGECTLDQIRGASSTVSADVWLAQNDRLALLRSNGTCRSYTGFENLTQSTNILGVFVDKNERVWVRLERQGLAELDPQTGALTLLELELLENVTVASVSEPVAGTLWLGTERNGLFAFTPETAELVPIDGTSDMSIYEIEPWRDGLLLATNKGVVQYEPQYRKISTPLSLPPRLEILSLSADERRQSVWVGTRSNGLYLASFIDGSASRMSQSTGFEGDTVRAIITDRHGAVWIGSNRGVFRTPPNTLTFSRSQGRDGLHGDTQYVGHYVAASDTVLFGGEQGINLINTVSKVNNPQVLAPVVTRFSSIDTAGTSLLDVNGEVSLAHEHKDFRFEFVLPNYDDPQRNAFRYRLKNYDQKWIEVNAQNRQGAYTNLPPGSYTLELAGANKDGVWANTRTSVNVTIAAAWWATGVAKLLYAIGLVLAVWWIARWRSYTALRRADRLEVQVERRTTEIAEQKTTIETLLKQKNDLFATISHEFRTPLTLIEGPLQQLEEHVPEGGQNRQVQLIRFSSQRLLKLVDQLLSLARLDRRQAPSVRAVRLQPVVAALVAAFKPAASDKNIRLTSSLFGDQLSSQQEDLEQVCVSSVPDAVEISLGNLLSNAIKFSARESAIHIAVEIKPEEVSIAVEDTGPGVPTKDQPYVFERFYRSEFPLKAPGTGLGLAIAQELALASSGSLELDTQYEAGARFVLTLPRTHSMTTDSYDGEAGENKSTGFVQSAFDPAADLNTGPEDGPAYHVADHEQTRPQVLVIDDDAMLRSFIVEALSTFDCHTAANGEEGIRLALERVPDLIVCDVMMPGADGFEVAHAIRNDERTSHIPFVLLTAKVDQESRLQGFRENVDDYLNKPFSPEELRVRLENILSVRRILQRRFGHSLRVEDGHSNELGDVTLLPEREARFMSRLLEAVEQRYSDCDFGPEDMASNCAMSLRQLQRKLKALTDCSPADYLRDFRLKCAARKLLNGDAAGRVADDCGFRSASQFSRCFKAHYGVAPKEYRKGELEQRRRAFSQSS